MYTCYHCLHKMQSKGYPARGSRVSSRRIRCNYCRYQVFECDILNPNSVKRIDKVVNLVENFSLEVSKPAKPLKSSKPAKLSKQVPSPMPVSKTPLVELLPDFRSRYIAKGLRPIKTGKFYLDSWAPPRIF